MSPETARSNLRQPETVFGWCGVGVVTGPELAVDVVPGEKVVVPTGAITVLRLAVPFTGATLRTSVSIAERVTA